MLLAAALLGTALFAGGLHGRALLTQGYSRYAQEHLRYVEPGDDALVAADWATRTAFFPVRPHITRAFLLERKGLQEDALHESRRALKYGAADPFVWQAHAMLKLQSNQFDAELTRALREVHRLAPRDFRLHVKNARLGLQYWSWGNPEQRALWMNSVRFVLETDAREFLRGVLQSRQEELFCHEFKAANPVVGSWCVSALQARKACYTPPLRPAAQAWCNRNGLLMPPVGG